MLASAGNASQHTAWHRALQVFRAMAAISQKDENFKIPASPDLVPEGPWKKVDGGVCAAKGFKATGGPAAVHSQIIASNTKRNSNLSAWLSLLRGVALHATAASVPHTQAHNKHVPVSTAHHHHPPRMHQPQRSIPPSHHHPHATSPPATPTTQAPTAACAPAA